MLASLQEVAKSANVCRSCRNRKQACNKTLPSCSRCASKLLRCDYGWMDTPQHILHHRSPSPVTAEPLLSRKCPDCFDLSAYGARQLLQAACGDPAPSSLTRLVNEIFESAQITTVDLMDEYFATVHRHLPIIDRGRLLRRLPTWLQSDEADLATVLWACHLVTRQPCPNSGHSMRDLWYRTTKQIFMLKATESPTLGLLQAGLMITYYECGHGLGREAYMSLGICLIIMRLMGLNTEEPSGKPDFGGEPWACCRALVLLDRTVALSSLDDSVPLLLPSNENFNAECLAPLYNLDTTYRCFDVSSRVAMAIGPAVSYANNPKLVQLGDSNYSETYDRLENLVLNLVHAAKTAPDTHIFCEGTLLAVSALLALQAVHPGSKVFGTQSRETMHLQSILRMVRDVYHTSTHMVCDGYANRISVMALCAMVRAAANFMRLCGAELGDEEGENLRFNLQRFGARWAIGRTYLSEFDKALHQ